MTRSSRAAAAALPAWPRRRHCLADRLPRSDIEIRPFSDEGIPRAAALLAARQSRLRAADPALPDRIASPAASQTTLSRLWGKTRSIGAVALDGDHLLAYMIGAPRPEPVWSRNMWVHTAGLALGEGVDPSVIADLYAGLGEAWVREGIFFHFALIPVAEPEIMHAWFALSLGVEQVHALVDLSTVDPSPTPPPGLAIRRAELADAETLAGFSDLIWSELLKAPLWGITLPESFLETRKGYAELATDSTATVWLAEIERRVVAIQGYWEPDEPDEIQVPEKAVTMSVFSTLPEFRGKGIQSALTRHGLAQARAAGYSYCETDWRSANRGVARSLPRLGFRPVAYRLVGRVDARIAGAARLNT